MTVVTNYETLQTAVLQALERENNDEAIALCPQWVQAAEDDFFAQLRAQWTIRVATFEWSTTELSTFEYLPPTFNGIVGITDLDHGKDLEPKPISQIGYWSQQLGNPQYYVIAGYMLQILPLPSQGARFMMQYYSRQERLSATPSGTNDIMRNLPSLYFQATLYHGYRFYGEDANAAKAAEEVSRLLNAVNAVESEWIRGADATIKLG